MRIGLYWGVLTLAPILIVVALGLATGPHLEGNQTLPRDHALCWTFPDPISDFKLLPVVNALV
jgi:hypothetical protein